MSFGRLAVGQKLGLGAQPTPLFFLLALPATGRTHSTLSMQQDTGSPGSDRTVAGQLGEAACLWPTH